jgi:uncharacterized tellurite resistance protein B-like protein
LRTYPNDSPRAAARIVALALLADGSLSRVELERLERMDAPARLGLSRDDLYEVVQNCCEDLLGAPCLSWDEACRLDRETMRLLLSEIRQPALRCSVLQLCASVADADSHITDGEMAVLRAAVEDWGIGTEVLGKSVAAASPLNA